MKVDFGWLKEIHGECNWRNTHFSQIYREGKRNNKSIKIVIIQQIGINCDPKMHFHICIVKSVFTALDRHRPEHAQPFNLTHNQVKQMQMLEKRQR